jgi:hypothetical protein
MADKHFNITDFVDQEIPVEVLEQLKVLGRIKHVLKPTQTSAYSQSETRPEVPSDSNQGLTQEPVTQRQVEDELNKIIDSITETEGLVEQVEDLIDEHLKDMAIPPANGTIAEAANRLGATNGIITKDVLDNAMSIMDYLPIISMGQDPVLTALIGDGTVHGDWLECNEITAGLAKKLKTPDIKVVPVEEPIEIQSNKITENHNQSLLRMMQEIILMLWWNQFWPKFVVEMVILNPLKLIVAIPIDTLFCFFQKVPFKRKKKSHIEKNGPVHKIIEKLKMFLLCTVPRKFYSRYTPAKELNLNCTNSDIDCGEDNEGPPKGIGKDVGISLADIFTDIGDNPPCVNSNDFKGEDQTTKGLGCSPECAKAAQVVLQAVMSDALTAPGIGSTYKNLINKGLNNVR